MTSGLPAGCYLCDYHIHTSLSFDASGTLDEHCRIAIGRGFAEIGFSEHVGVDPSDDAYGTLDYESYREAVEEMRRYHSGKLRIKMGVEVDFRSNVVAETEKYIRTHEFDFVTGALHYLGSEILLGTRIFESRPAREVWDDYFAEMLKMAKTGLFDIIAHLDVPKRGHVPLHGRFDWTVHEGRIRSVLAEIIKRGAVLEINTAGLRKQAREIFPSPGILRLYRELGGEYVTFGSDAHSVPSLGRDIGEAVKAAEAAGFTHLVTFSARSKALVPIRNHARRKAD